MNFQGFYFHWAQNFEIFIDVYIAIAIYINRKRYPTLNCSLDYEDIKHLGNNELYLPQG